MSPGQYREYLLALARSRVGSWLGVRFDDSDIVQETILKAHRARDQFRGNTEEQLAAWLRTILSNTLANAARTVKRSRAELEFSIDQALEQSSARLPAGLADPAPKPDEVASQNEQLLRLAAALEKLPEDQRVVLEMKHLQGWSVLEICERTGRSKSSVAGLLFRGIKALRGLLGDSHCERLADEE